MGRQVSVSACHDAECPAVLTPLLSLCPPRQATGTRPAMPRTPPSNIDPLLAPFLKLLTSEEGCADLSNVLPCTRSADHKLFVLSPSGALVVCGGFIVLSYVSHVSIRCWSVSLSRCTHTEDPPRGCAASVAALFVLTHDSPHVTTRQHALLHACVHTCV